jgi:hypothetical protein
MDARCWCGRCCRIRRVSLWLKDRVCRVGKAVRRGQERRVRVRVRVEGLQWLAQRLEHQPGQNLLTSQRLNPWQGLRKNQLLRLWRQRLGL